MKTRHELRDGIHGFIEFDNVERRLIDSEPVQRLRNIHQLAMCYQVYPGATHRRFEHSLGVMEVAGRIFDVVTRPGNLSDAVRDRIADEVANHSQYWRRVVRLAGLLHDVGHLPFSHGAEEWLPPGWNHERITVDLIRHSVIRDIIQEGASPINPEHVVNLCWDQSKRAKVEPITLSPWETLLNEIITGNTFGADRIDYLLRDSWHAGVAYGRFDPDRLIAGLRIVIAPDSNEVALGLDGGAIHAAEALLLARYFMYTQVYFHDVRRVYDIHLKDFVRALRNGRPFPTDWQEHLKVTDNNLQVEMQDAARDSAHRLHRQARAVVGRQHFRTVYELLAADKQRCPTILTDVKAGLEQKFGEDNVRVDSYGPKSEANQFPVVTDSGSVESSTAVSGVISNIPALEVGFAYIEPTYRDEARALAKSIVAKLTSKRRPPQAQGSDMNYNAHRVILEAVHGLRKHGSWTGKTHVIKTLFLASCKTRLPFDFILYKHGPYSFDVETELEQMRSYRAVESTAVSGYGPQLKSGPGTSFLDDELEGAQAAAIADACKFVGGSDVAALEALATAAWIRHREGMSDPHQVVARLRELKPHISQETAVWAEAQVRAKWLP